jgi:purine-cytosine permease-like protein
VALPLPLLLDIVIGYQVSWPLMFTTTASPEGALSGVAVSSAALTAVWLMPLGWRLARHAGSADPGAMLAAADAGTAAAVLIVLATITTNFVNIYLSSLAWRSVVPAVGSGAAVWIVGLIGTGLGLTGGWLDRFAGFMTLVGSYSCWSAACCRPLRAAAAAGRDRGALYGPLAGIRWPGIVAWAAGVAMYYLMAGGATVPSLVAAIAAYLLLTRRLR